MKPLILIGTLAALLATAPRAAAIEPLTASQLQEVCAEAIEAPDTVAAGLCVYYVKGFLDGAVATDQRVAENVASELDADEESFTERAFRTRVRVLSRLQEFGPSVYAEFCVGQPDPIVDVIQHVIEELDHYDDLEGLQAQAVVYASLRRHYPCTRDRATTSG